MKKNKVINTKLIHIVDDMLTDKYSLNDIAKKVFEIRKILGYATKEQVKKGWKDELKSIKELITMGDLCESGGFGVKIKGKKIFIYPTFIFEVERK